MVVATEGSVQLRNNLTASVCILLVLFELLFVAWPVLSIQGSSINPSLSGKFRLVSSLADSVDPQIASYLDVLSVTIETDDTSFLRFNWTLRGALPDANLFMNKTLDDGLSYAWWIDSDRNSSTGQTFHHVGSEYNLMFQASGGSPTGKWGSRIDTTVPGLPGGGPVDFLINENMVSLTVNIAQIGGVPSFDWSITTWGNLNGVSLGSNPETTAQTSYVIQPAEQSPTILLLVNENLYPEIRPSLSIFEQDLVNEGYSVINATVSDQTAPPEIKNIITSFYQSAGNLVGAILIGKIRSAYLEIFTGSTDPQTHETSVYWSLDACDMYYMDLDGMWEHVTNPNFTEGKPPIVANCYQYPSCDTFKNEYVVSLDEEGKKWNYSQIEDKSQFMAEIWISRIMAHNLDIPGKNEAQIINDYFERNHNYRVAADKVASKAFMLTAWQESGPGAFQSMNYSGVVETITQADDVTKSYFLNCLQDPEGSKLLFLGAHSYPQGHQLYDQMITTDELIGKNKTSAFYILNACSSCRWDQYVSSPSDPNYLGGLYVFDTSPSSKNNGLGAIGFTGVGGFNWLNYFADCLRVNRNASFGDAYKYWFNSMLIQFMCCWPPGALNYVYLGDATIGLKHPIMKVHDVAITGINPYRTIVCTRTMVSINVTIANQGSVQETFTLVASYNSIVFRSQMITVGNGSSVKWLVSWNTSGISIGNYSVTASVDQLPGENDTSDNSLSCTIQVSILGDINGDGKVDMKDVSKVSAGFLTHPGDTKWTANGDLDENKVIDMKDISAIAKHFGEHYP